MVQVLKTRLDSPETPTVQEIDEIITGMRDEWKKLSAIREERLASLRVEHRGYTEADNELRAFNEIFTTLVPSLMLKNRMSTSARPLQSQSNGTEGIHGRSPVSSLIIIA